MHRHVFALVALVGCFNPKSDRAAPDGGAGDASQDGTVTSADRDGDGVDNAKDNCPDNANTDQGNEDGDTLGDACDLCPHLAGASTADADGDTIGDACDANAAVKDSVWLFEGFHKGLPQWGFSTSWAASTDSVTATASGAEDQYVAIPLAGHATYDNVAVTLSALPKALPGTSHTLGMSVYDAQADKYIDCGVGSDSSTSAIYLADDANINNKKTFSWPVNTAFTLTMKRAGTLYTCTAVSASGATQTVTATTPITPRNGAAFEMWANNVTAQFNSLFVTGP